jgi:hypothetical protein
MAKIARIPITNIYAEGDYTGCFLIGPQQKPMNLLLDTGSSALAIDGRKYQPDVRGGDTLTNQAQTDKYGDKSSWTGAVINTRVTAGSGAAQVTLPNANCAVAYAETSNMFGKTDGILGLAYAKLDDAFKMPGPTWPREYTYEQVITGSHDQLVPYLTQLSDEGVVSDKVSFLTRRSFVHQGGGADDPLNQGWMIIGGGEECMDLYTGTFQSVKVLSDDWYSTNLKAIVVGQAAPIPVSARAAKGASSNSIVDSGTNSLNLGRQLLDAVLSKFSAEQRALLAQCIFQRGHTVSMSELGDLSQWPNLTFILEGTGNDVSLVVSPVNYWQTNTQRVGAAVAAITPGDGAPNILGLPLMNGYFTIFDGAANDGRGVIKFAPSK